MNPNAKASPCDPETGETQSITHGKPVSTQIDFLRRTITQPKAIIGLVILSVFILMALFAPLIAPNNPNKYVGFAHEPPTTNHWLGTTGQGQDVFTQLVWGSRISLLIGFSVGILSTILGLAIGMISGYIPGVVDGVLNMFTNVFLLIPGLPLLITLASFLPQGMLTVMLVLTFTGWAWPARVFRSQVLCLREKGFRFRFRRQRGANTKDCFFGNPPQYAFLSHVFPVRRSNLYHRSRRRIGFPWVRKCQYCFMGHHVVLGFEQFRPAPRGLVDICAPRFMHCPSFLCHHHAHLRHG